MIKLLIVLVAIVFIAQVVRIFEIGSIVSKTKMKFQTDLIILMEFFLLIAGIGLVAFFFGKRAEWMDQTLPIAASEHGPVIDQLWDVTMGLIIFVFLLLTPILFGVAYYFRGREDRQASYITHNNKLEFFDSHSCRYLISSY